MNDSEDNIRFDMETYLISMSCTVNLSFVFSFIYRFRKVNIFFSMKIKTTKHEQFTMFAMQAPRTYDKQRLNDF